ncbi:MAG TPA: hypothetical protein PK733_02975 [Clostridiales bacterium]|nr:hypothetical protein [Clostridiales bacterium]
MKLYGNSRKVYLVHKMGEENYKLCKVLNEYSSVDEAHDDLTKLLTDQKTEGQLLREFGKKE